MFLNKYLHHSQIGTRKQNNDGHLDLQFLLPRFECKEDRIYSVQGRHSNSPPFSIEFCPVKGQEHIYALACEEGQLMFMDSKADIKDTQIHVWNGHGNAVFDMSWLRNGSHLLTASGDQTIGMWDTKTLQCVASFRGHGSSVKTITLKPDNDCVFLTGSRDGNIFFWDTRTNSDPYYKPVYSITNAHNTAVTAPTKKRTRKGLPPTGMNNLNTVTCVRFQDENIFLSTGASDWSIKGWDIRYLQPSLSSPVPLFDIRNSVENHKNQGYTCLAMNPDGKSFFANCMDGTIFQYEVDRTAPTFISSFYGHQVHTYFIRLAISPDGQFILSGSSNDNAYIWQVSKPGLPLVTMEGHCMEVTCVSWYPDDVTRLITCGDDEQVFHWSIGSPYEERDVCNRVIGTSRLTKPEDVKVPSSHEARTPLSYTTPSTSYTESPPLSAPCLTHWFTPKTKTKEECLKCECTPKTGTISEASTPIKSRSVFCELGNHDCRKVAGISAIRKTINFGNRNDVKPAHQSKRAKLSTQQTNYSIKKFFHASPRT